MGSDARPDIPQFPRFITPRIDEALADSPVVLVHGPRQSGKSTLARTIGEARDQPYFSFDDDVIRRAAEGDPAGFVAGLPERATLDEVQRVPQLFTSLKSVIDRDRTPGRFLLTGSANVLLVPSLSDSLAGRMEIQRLHPLAQCEIERHEPRFLAQLLAGEFSTTSAERLGDGLIERIVAGGYPAAIARDTERRRSTWYRNYIDAIVQRDVRDLTRISSLDALPRLLTLASAQTACLLNVSGLATDFQLSRPTIRDYLTLLERIFLAETLPPWHTNRLSRLIKTPKLHVGDTGLACALLGLGAADLKKDRTVLGQMVETFVFQELRRQASWYEDSLTFSHFRDKEGAEVGIVIELGARDVAGVHVKTGATVTSADFRGLRKLKAASGKKFRSGVVVYDGEATVPFEEGLWAVPVRMLWEA